MIDSCSAFNSNSFQSVSFFVVTKINQLSRVSLPTHDEMGVLDNEKAFWGMKALCFYFSEDLKHLLPAPKHYGEYEESFGNSCFYLFCLCVID
jgi:hypothetical protein